MQIIKSVITFSACLPPIAELEKEAAAYTHTPPLPSYSGSKGFITDPLSERLITPFEGGYSMIVQVDEKILPAGPVKKAIAVAQKETEKEYGRPLDKAEMAEVKEVVMTRLVQNALIKTTIVRAIYWPAEKLLFVLTGSKPMAQEVIRLLIHACESVKTTTIHVDGVRAGLTARLRNHLENMPKDFGDFHIGSYVAMKNLKEKIVFDVESIESAERGLLEAVHSGMTVDKIELSHNTFSFTLDSNFRMSKIEFAGNPEEGEAEGALDAAEIWANQAYIESVQVAAAVEELCRIFGRQNDIEFDAEEAVADEQ